MYMHICTCMHACIHAHIHACIFLMMITGAIHISQALVMKCNLWKLNITGNNVGDKGSTAIAKALINSSISSLFLCNCGITFNGADSLAKVLPTYHNMEELWLFDNVLTVDGAHLIMQSAITNTTCEAVWVDSIYENDSEVGKLMAALDRKVRQQ